MGPVSPVSEVEYYFLFFPAPFLPVSIMAPMFELFRPHGTGPVRLSEGSSGTCAAEDVAPDQSGSIDTYPLPGGVVNGSVPILEETASSSFSA